MEYKALKDIARITMGQSPDSSSYNEEKDGLPFFQGNADFGELYPNERVWCNEPKKVAEPGDILISVRAPIGALNYAKDECCIGRGLAAIAIEDEAERNYVFHLLKARNNDLNQKGTGSTFKAIGKNVLEEIAVPQISRDEQQKCMDMMDLLESIIRERKSQLDKLDELIKARFVEMFDKCNEEVLIGDAISISRGASPRPIQSFITDDPEGVNWIKIGDVSENSLYITRTAEKITKEGAKKSRAVHKGDFILSNSMSFGRPYILGIEGCVHDGWLVLSDFRDTFDELYLYHALRSEYVQHQFSGKVNGATVKNLNSDLVKETYIKVPEMKEQETFADFVKQVDKSKVIVQKALNETQTLFDSLMQEYFG